MGYERSTLTQPLDQLREGLSTLSNPVPACQRCASSLECDGDRVIVGSDLQRPRQFGVDEFKVAWRKPCLDEPHQPARRVHGLTPDFFDDSPTAGTRFSEPNLPCIIRF